MQRRANVLVLLGLAVVVIGGGLVFLTTRGNAKGGGPAKTVPVVVVKAPVDKGTTTDDLVSSGRLEITNVAPSKKAATAVTSTDGLSGQITIRSLKAGDQLTTDALRTRSLRTQAISIPKGKTGVSVTLPFTAAGGGYAGAGDTIDIYTYQSPEDPGTPAAITKLLVPDVQVLDVSQQVAPAVDTTGVTTAANGATTPRAEGENVTYLLALSPADAEHVIFATSFNHLYFTIAPNGDGPAKTPGVKYDNQLP